MPTRAVISIGTNSTRLLILRGETIAVAHSLGTRLGRGLGTDGNLDPIARERTLSTIRDYAATVRANKATVDAIATSALRRANDAATFAEDVKSLLGVAPRVISGDEEAAYSYLGATWGARKSGRTGVLDVGGGSTELAVGTADVIERTISLEIGAVRLAERHPALLGAIALDAPTRAEVIAIARADAGEILAPLAQFQKFDDLLAVGGTVFTAAGMITGDPARDGVPISGGQRRELVDALLSHDLAGRRAMAHIRPQRADILPAGLIIVDEACVRLGIDVLRVSHADLLAGYMRSADYRAVSLH